MLVKCLLNNKFHTKLRFHSAESKKNNEHVHKAALKKCKYNLRSPRPQAHLHLQGSWTNGLSVGGPFLHRIGLKKCKYANVMFREHIQLVYCKSTKHYRGVNTHLRRKTHIQRPISEYWFLLPILLIKTSTHFFRQVLQCT